MAAKTWEKDFRYQAIQASIQSVDVEAIDQFACPNSYCLPVGKTPMRWWNPGKLALVFLVLGFAGLAVGAVIAAFTEKFPNIPEGLKMTVAGVCSLSGMCCFFLPVLVQKRVTGLFMGERGRRLLNATSNKSVMSAEVSRPNDQSISIDGDDHVLAWCDTANQRIVIGGLSSRYQINKRDIIQVREFVFMNYLGSEIHYRVGEVTLALAVAKPSLKYELIRQLPILFFLKPKNHVHLAISDALTD